LSLIDPSTNRVVVNASVGSNATRVLLTSTAVWITDYADSLVLRVDPLTGQVVGQFAFLGPDGITKDGDSLVVASFDGNIVGRIDPGTGELLQQVDVGGSPTAVYSDATYGLWAAVFDTGEIVQIDQSSFGIRQRVVVGAGPVGITSDGTHLYVTNNGEGTVAKVDPFTGDVVWTAPVGEEPTEVVVVDDAAWATVTGEGSLVQLDLETGEVVSRTPLGGAVAGGGPTGISYGAGALWIAMQGEQSVQKVEL
jgi:YVTN family beta-propeller protein